MLGWLEEVSSDEIYDSPNIGTDGDIDFRSFNTSFDRYDITVTTLGQFFTTQVALSEPRTVTTIPIPSTEIFNTIMEEVAIHFSEVKGVYYDNILREVRLSNLKESSKIKVRNLHDSNQLDPIVKNLYGAIGSRPSGFMTKTKYFKVKHLPDSSEITENTFTQAWKIINNCYGGELSLVPTDWKVDDALRNAAALNYFSRACRSTYLVVDVPSLTVIGLDLKW